MPIVRIDIQAGKTTAYKRALLNAVRDAMTDALGVPDDRIMQRIVETPPEDIDTVRARADHLTIIEISMLPGRDAPLKAELYRAISKRVGFAPGIAEEDLVILVNDPAAECFYLHGEIPAKPSAAKSGKKK